MSNTVALSRLVDAQPFLPKSFKPSNHSTAPPPATTLAPSAVATKPAVVGAKDPSKIQYSASQLRQLRAKLYDSPEAVVATPLLQSSVAVARSGLLAPPQHRGAPRQQQYNDPSSDSARSPPLAATNPEAWPLPNEVTKGADVVVEELTLRESRRQNFLKKKAERKSKAKNKKQNKKDNSNDAKNDGNQNKSKPVPPFAAVSVTAARAPQYPIPLEEMVAQSPSEIIHTVEHIVPPFLLQTFEVITAALAVETALPQRRYPASLCRLVLTFLCAEEGFHLLAPASGTTTGEAQYAMYMTLLGFDRLRDNSTPVYTQLSQRWRLFTPPSLQFQYFLKFRDWEPPEGVTGMLVHRQKPVLAACITLNVVALVVLAKLRFWIVPDSWFVRGSPLLSYWDSSVDALRCFENLCDHFMEQKSRQGSVS